MSDHGFDFQKAAERREKGRFEIPPWEQEAFEEMQRRRQEQSPEAEQGSAGGEAVEPTTAETAPGPPEGAGRTAAAGPRAAETATETATAVVADGPAVAVEPVRGPSEAEVAALLAKLSSEEPGMEKGIGIATVVTAALLLPTGIMLLVWGMGGMVKARAAIQSFGPGAGTQMQLAAGTMILFGAGFMVGALWLVYRYLRQRGVI